MKGILRLSRKPYSYMCRELLQDIVGNAGVIPMSLGIKTHGSEVCTKHMPKQKEWNHYYE